MAMHVVAEAQRNGGICAYIDAEHAMDPIYAKAIGVDEGSGSADLLRFCDDMQRKRRLARAFRAINLDHPAAGYAATESITTTSSAPERTSMSTISSACSPVSGWEMSSWSMSTPMALA